MIKSLITLGVGLLCAADALAAVKVTRVGNNELVAELSSEKPSLTAVKLAQRDYTDLKISNTIAELPLGYPKVPFERFVVLVPQGTKAVLSVADKVSEVLPLTSELAYKELEDSHCQVGARAAKDEGAYGGKTYGNEIVDIEEESYAASDRVAVLRYWPVRYNTAQKNLRWTKSAKVTVKFIPTNRREVAPVKSRANSVASYIAINPAAVRPTNHVSKPVDLIIAHESYREGLTRLIDFKKANGREVREYYVKDKTNTEIKDLIKEEYKKETAPTSTLLVGNIDQVPSWRGNGDNRWTDFPYQALDSGTVPDTSVGRVPAHTNEELQAFIDKAISREKDPRDVHQMLMTAGRDVNLGCAASVTKVGENLKTANSSVTVVKKYKSEVTTDEVIAAYNENPNIVVYDGHGNRSGMTEIPLIISNLDRLTNTSYPIILDIACLNANWGTNASPRNFAESILLKPLRGVAGIMASGGSGYGHDFFQSIGALMADFKKNPNSDPKMNEIGQIILAAKIKHGTQDRTYWNYYGDPATSVWEGIAMR